jgi:chromosome segregation ATPase
MEKEIWKWILETFSDEGIANIANTFGIKIQGFRHINAQQKKFKIVRQRIIQEALHQRNAQNLITFFDSAAEGKPEIESLRGKSIEELLHSVEEDLHPSILLGVLLSSEDEEDQAIAQEIYVKLKEEDKLDLLEKQADAKLENAEYDEEEQGEQVIKIHKELEAAQQNMEKLEKKLKKLEQKNEELKTQEALAQAAIKSERKQWKADKKELLHEIQTLKGEIGTLKSKTKSVFTENESFYKRFENQAEIEKKKDDEIKRLHALVLKLNTDLDKLSNLQGQGPVGQVSQTPEANNNIRVAMIGDPKNSRIQKYNRFDLTILVGSEMEEEKNQNVLDRVDQVWFLTYKIPRSVQRRVSSIVKGKQMKEFATFIDLENYMLKGMI